MGTKAGTNPEIELKREFRGHWCFNYKGIDCSVSNMSDGRDHIGGKYIWHLQASGLEGESNHFKKRRDAVQEAIELIDKEELRKLKKLKNS